jgi:hypothetical protein
MELKVRVRLLDEPALWCWELVDPVSGTIRENSWTSEWEAYASPEEALRAATAHLTAPPSQRARSYAA